MPAEFPALTDAAEIDALFDRSKTAPVVIFKHDPYCPISMGAYRRMTQFSGDVVLVDVANAQTLASAITERTGVRHESPQVILLKDGQAIWSASHYAITPQAVMDAAQQ